MAVRSAKCEGGDDPVLVLVLARDKLSGSDG
jgi:hypothetical protein